LMLEFYKLLKNGIDKATALQQAQITIMQKEGYSHPYYWAPFILVGDSTTLDGVTKTKQQTAQVKPMEKQPDHHEPQEHGGKRSIWKRIFR